MAHPIENIMRTTMESIQDMMDVNVVVGEPIETAAGTIVPLSRVSVGFVAGGGEYTPMQGGGQNGGNQGGKNGGQASAGASEGEKPFAGGAGAGVSLQPVGFLVVTPNCVRVMPSSYNTALDRVIEHIPDWLDKLRDVVGDVCEGKEHKCCNAGEGI